MKKYTYYYIVLVACIFMSFTMSMLGMIDDIYPVFALFGIQFIILVMVWSGVPKHDKYTEKYQKEVLTDRFNAKYGKDS